MYVREQPDIIVELKKEETKGILDSASSLKEPVVSKKPESQSFNNLSDLLLKSISNAVFVTDNNFTITKWNTAAEKIYGWKEQEVLGKSFHSILKIEFSQGTFDDFLHQLKDEKKWFGTTVQYHKNGEQLSISSQVYFVSNDMQEPIGFLVVNEKSSEENVSCHKDFYDTIFHASPSSIMTVDEKGNITSWNPASEKIFGWKREEVIGKFNPTVPEDMKEMYFDSLKKENKNYLIKVKRKDGKLIDINLSTTPLFNDNGTFNGSLGVMTDITDQMSSEERFRKISDVTTDLIYEWNVQTDSLSWFGDIDASLGYESGEIPHTIEGWVSRIHPEDIKKLENSVELHRTSTKPIFEVYRIKKKDGTWAYWEDRGTPILNENNQPIKWIGGCKDVTPKKLQEQQLTEQLEKLQRYKKVTIGRELKMKELKEKINRLEKQLEKTPESY